MISVAGRVGLVIAVSAAGGVLLSGHRRPVFRTDVNFITVDTYPVVR